MLHLALAKLASIHPLNRAYFFFLFRLFHLNLPINLPVGLLKNIVTIKCLPILQ